MSRDLLRARLNFVEGGGVARGVGQLAWIIRSSQRCERQGRRSADSPPTTAKVGRKE